AGIGLSALGLVALALLWRAGPVAMRPDDSWWAPGDRGDAPTGPPDDASDDLDDGGAAVWARTGDASSTAPPLAGSGAWTPTAGYDPGEPPEGTWAPPVVPIAPAGGPDDAVGSADAVDDGDDGDDGD